MPSRTSITSNFRELRERAGLSLDEAAAAMGVSPFHIETDDAEFTCSYSLADAQRFCRVLGARPSELFGVEVAEAPVSAEELVRRIHEEYRKRGITLETFEDAVGWRLSACMEPPEHLFNDMSLDGLQWLCRELHVHWHRVILGL
jgi:transcriptional regulator with XRE-family HTH domain